jgi:hypothetical protein
MANPVNEQYGNNGYNRVGDSGSNPYDQHDGAGDRYDEGRTYLHAPHDSYT